MMQEKINQENIDIINRDEVSEDIKVQLSQSQAHSGSTLHALDEQDYPNIVFAGFTKRLFAYTIDMMIANAIAGIVLNTLLAITSASVAMTVRTLGVTLIVLLYFFLMTYYNNGQTLGKMILGLRVISLKNDRLNVLDTFIRECVGRFIHMYHSLAFLYLVIIVSKKKQSFSDIFSDTSVVDISKVDAFQLGTLRCKQPAI